MKRNSPRSGSGNRSGRRPPQCAHRNLGQGRGGDCSYGRRSSRVSSRSLASLMSSVLGGMLELADRSIRRLSTAFNQSNLLGDGSSKSGASLPDLEFRREDLSRRQENNRKLPENHEESQLIADQQK